MDSQRIETNVDVVRAGPWSPWSEWGPKGWWFLAISIRRRTRTVTRQVSRVAVETRCGIAGGSTPTGGGLRPWATWTTRRPIGSSIEPEHAEVQEEWRWFDPPKERFDWLATAAPAIPSGVRLSIETNWVKSLKGVVGYRAWLDGEPYRHVKLIDTASLERGHHAFDLEIDMDDGSIRHHHVSFAVIDPVTLRFDQPVTPFRIDATTEGPNGGTLHFTAKNVTSNELVTTLEVLAVEEGWAAVIPGESVLELAPGEERDLALQFELMQMAGLNETSVAAFTVAVSPFVARKRAGAEGRPLAVATAYVAFEGDQAMLQQARDANRAIRQGEMAPLTFGDPTSSPSWKI